MIKREYLSIVSDRLQNFSAVGLLGPRQIGKTTLAFAIAQDRATLYLDLENPQDLAKLDDPVSYLELHKDKLIILDEIQRKPDLFVVLRGLIDKRRREGNKFGQFLILGSASLDLLRQSSESLAGRISYIEISPISAIEIDSSTNHLNELWLRGGFPDSLLAKSNQNSMEWRQAFIKTYLERDIPQFGPRIPSETLRRFWVMLAHSHGAPLNASRLATNLSVSSPTIGRYVDLLTDLFLVNRLTSWNINLGKRLIKSPKIYVRDSGILHSLLNLNSIESLLSHPIVGASWEGFVIDNLVSFLPLGAETYFYRTQRGAEIDLIIKLPDRRLLAIEIKRSSSPKVERGFYEATQDIQPTHKYLVYSGEERYSVANNITVIGLKDLMNEIRN
jgi:uncharacterized protein